MTSEGTRMLVQMAEELADAQTTESEVMAEIEKISTDDDLYGHASTPAEFARVAAFNSCYGSAEGDAAGNASWAQFLATCPNSTLSADYVTREQGWALEKLPQAAFLRDVFGSLPFRPVILEPAYSAVEKLAETIYQDRAFDLLPILADALEDAGCTNADILNHCRQPGEHVRGCCVIDLLTGRQ